MKQHKQLEKVSQEVSQKTSSELKRRNALVEAYEEEKDGKITVSLRVSKKEVLEVYQEVYGTPNIELGYHIVNTACGGLPRNEKASHKQNIIYQALADRIPKDAHEAQLIAQATVLYTQGMYYLRKASFVISEDDNVTMDKQGWHALLMKSATRLLDLHNKTMEAFTRYRQQGEQRITVQHVNVNDGGKAIVGGNLELNGDGVKH